MHALHPLTVARLYAAYQNSDGPAHARVLARAVRVGVDDVFGPIRAHVLSDDWQDFAFASLADYWQRQSGHLYVAVNPVTPSVYKVGKTRLDPVLRMHGLNNEAVVGSFICVQSWAVHDRHALETAAHKSLRHLERHKEFFRGSWAAVCAPVRAAIDADINLFTRQGLPVSSFE